MTMTMTMTMPMQVAVMSGVRWSDLPDEEDEVVAPDIDYSEDEPAPQHVSPLELAGVLVNEAFSEAFYNPVQLRIAGHIPHRELNMRVSLRDLSPALQSEIFTINTGIGCETVYSMVRRTLHLESADPIALQQGIAFNRRIVPRVGSLMREAQLMNPYDGRLKAQVIFRAKLMMHGEGKRAYTALADGENRSKETIMEDLRCSAIALAVSGHDSHIILGLRVGLQQKTVTGIAKHMRLLCHPDKNPGNARATDAMHALQDALDEHQNLTPAQICMMQGSLDRVPEEMVVMQILSELNGTPPPTGFRTSPEAHDVPDTVTVAYEFRKEYFSLPAVYTFLERTAARRLRTPAKGSFARALLSVLDRGQPTDDPNILEITVVLYQFTVNGYRKRRQSGIKALHDYFAGELPHDIVEATKHEKDSSFAGKSIFHTWGKLLRCVCRTGLKGVEVDLKRAFFSLRYYSLPAGLQSKCKSVRTYVCDTDTFMSDMMTVTGYTADAIKGAVTSAGNLGTKHRGMHPALEDFCNCFKKENKMIMEYMTGEHKELWARCRANGVGLLSFMAIIDHDQEADVVDKFDKTNGMTCCNEYDGCYFFFVEYPQNLLQMIQEIVKPHQVGIKVLDDPLTCAKTKYPLYDWDHINDTPPHEYILLRSKCADALWRGAAFVRNLDTIFARFVMSSTTICFNVGRAVGDIEVWNDGARRWISGRGNDSLVDVVKSELTLAFGRSSEDPVTGDVHYHDPPQPLEADSFLTSVARCCVKYSPPKEMISLDHLSNASGKLLFNDGTLYDFDQRLHRLAQPSDRLSRHCKIQFPTWDAPQDVQEMVVSLGADVLTFFKSGGTTLVMPSTEDLGELLLMSAEYTDDLQALRQSIRDKGFLFS